MNTKHQFMVDFTLPNTLTQDFMEMIPYQRAVVDRFLEEGILLQYALSLETSKLWAVFNAHSEYEVLDFIADLPLSEHMTVQISMLTIFNSVNHSVPDFSLN